MGFLVARCLQPEGYDTLMFGLVIVGVARSLRRFGIEQIPLLQIASGDWAQKSVLSQEWIISTILGLLCFLAVVTVTSVFKDESLRIGTMALGIGFIDQISSTYSLVFQA